MGSTDIIKPLSTVLCSAVNKSQQNQEKNSWELQETNLCALQPPDADPILALRFGTQVSVLPIKFSNVLSFLILDFFGDPGAAGIGQNIIGA